MRVAHDREELLAAIRQQAQLDFKIHPTPESVLLAYWSFGEEEFDPRTDEFGGTTEDGEELVFTWEGQVEAVREGGFWGYVDVPNRTVHMWAAPDTDPHDLMLFLGHEVGHATGVQCEDPGDEEDRADTYGAVTAEAFRIFQAWQTTVLEGAPE